MQDRDPRRRWASDRKERRGGVVGNAKSGRHWAGASVSGNELSREARAVESR